MEGNAAFQVDRTSTGHDYTPVTRLSALLAAIAQLLCVPDISLYFETADGLTAPPENGGEPNMNCEFLLKNFRWGSQWIIVDVCHYDFLSFGIEECSSNPCLDATSRQKYIGAYTCFCDDGFLRSRCETDQ